MIRRVLLFCLFGIIAFMLACGQSEEKAVGRIGEEMITVGMLKDEYLAITMGSRPNLVTIEDKEQFAKDVVSKEILEMEARKVGLDRMPEVMEMGQSELARRAWQAYYEDHVRSQVEVTEDDLRALYAKQRYRYELGWIFLRSAEVAQQVGGRLEAGEDFGKLASIYSLDASRERNGDLGSRALGTMPDNVEDEVMEMATGDVKGPIPYETYYIFVKLYSKEPVEQPEFETARTGLQSLETMRRENRQHRDLAKRVRAKYGLTFNEDVVAMVAERTRELHPGEDTGMRQVPSFSDEELARVIASYKGGEWQVRTYVERLQAQRGMVVPGPGTDSETIKSIVTDFITGDLWMLEIKDEGYEERPDIVRAAERKQEEMLVSAMHDQVVKDVTINDEALREVYEEQKEEMVTDPAARLAVIALETMEEAEEVYRQLEDGGDFAALARGKSIDRATAENDGEILREVSMPQLEQFPELEELVEQLAEGAYSRPIGIPPGFGPAGYMVVKVLEKIEPRQLEFEEVKEMLGQRVLQLEQDRVFGQWLRDKMQEYEVELYPDALGGINFADLREQEA
jgi:parvulin-like peptidyl-prolyl isomerase